MTRISHKIQAHDVDLRPEDIGAPTKEYVDDLVLRITETGIPKLMVYPLSNVATEDNQTEFNINLGTFDINTDTVFVQSGRTMLSPNLDFSVEDNKVVLKEGVQKGRTVEIYVFKNVPLGEEGSVSGIVLAPNSIPLNRLEVMPATPDYVDQQIAKSAETGVPKLMVYPFSQVSTTDNQTVFNIALNTFDSSTDTVLVQSGRTMLFPNEDFTVVDKTIVLNEGVPKDVTIGIYIFKNVPLGEDGSVSGVVISPKSLPLDRLAEEVLATTGGTMIGNLCFDASGKDGVNGVGYLTGQCGDNGSYAHMQMILWDIILNTQASILLRTRNPDGNVVKLSDILRFYKDGVEYNIYGEHNPPKCNNNILINSNFANPVNQRGQTEYVGTANSYCIDRWRLVDKNTKCSIVNGGIKFSHGTSSNSVDTFRQVLEGVELNKHYSLSAKINGEVGSFTFLYDGSKTYDVKGISDGVALSYYIDSTNHMNINIEMNANKKSEIIIEWAKLEIGDHATPYVPRLYAEELQLCKRYYQRYESALIPCFIVSSNKAASSLLLQADMRNIPTVRFNLIDVGVYNHVTTGWNKVTNVVAYHVTNRNCGLDISFEGNLTTGYSTNFSFTNDGNYIEFDAEL